MLSAVRLALLGWENFRDSKGAVVKFETLTVGTRKVASDKCLNMLRSEWVIELWSEIIKLNFPTEQAEKN